MTNELKQIATDLEVPYDLLEAILEIENNLLDLGTASTEATKQIADLLEARI